MKSLAIIVGKAVYPRSLDLSRVVIISGRTVELETMSSFFEWSVQEKQSIRQNLSKREPQEKNFAQSISALLKDVNNRWLKQMPKGTSLHYIYLLPNETSISRLVNGGHSQIKRLQKRDVHQYLYILYTIRLTLHAWRLFFLTGPPKKNFDSSRARKRFESTAHIFALNSISNSSVLLLIIYLFFNFFHISYTTSITLYIYDW